jgi:hypothetical protein
MNTPIPYLPFELTTVILSLPAIFLLVWGIGGQRSLNIVFQGKMTVPILAFWVIVSPVIAFLEWMFYYGDAYTRPETLLWHLLFFFILPTVASIAEFSYVLTRTRQRQ